MSHEYSYSLLFKQFNKMTKREAELDVAELDDQNRKKIKDSNSEPIKKSNLQYFIQNPKMIQLLENRGVKKLFPIQYETYQAIFKGDDLIARDRTGSGKTLAFALPIIQRFREKGYFEGERLPKFLIVLPTRELAIQVTNEIKTLRLRNDFEVIAVYGGSDIHEQIRKIREGCDIIVSTPGRLLDLLERGVIKLHKLQVTCLDQADQMLKQGFQEDIERIFEFIEKNGDRKTQNLLFSATIPSWVVQLSRKYLSPNRVFIDLIKNNQIKTSKTVQHLCLPCPYSHRNSIIADIVNLYGGRHGRTIIFCETKRQANQILLKANLKQQTQVLHGDIPQKQRQVTFQSFKEGKLKCLVATNVAARGLDIPQVDLIVQLQPPKEIDAYIHRAGRTGRAGKSGVCVTFYTRQQESLIERIERVAKIKLKKVGAPQPVDIMKSSARDIVISLKSVNETVLTYFNQIAEEMINQEGGVKALSKALAFISGNTKKISQRSLLCSIEGYITYLLKTPIEYQSPGYIYTFLRRNTSEKLVESVKGMQRHSKKAAVFDVAEEYRNEMDKLIETIKQLKNPSLNGYEIEMVTSIDMLQDQDQTTQNGGKGDDKQEQYDDRQRNYAYQNRKQLQIFIGSLPSNCDESQLSEYFRSRRVQITNLRILRNEQGQSKCVAFGICLDEDNLKKALYLDGERFGSRTIRINKAAKKN